MKRVFVFVMLLSLSSMAQTNLGPLKINGGTVINSSSNVAQVNQVNSFTMPQTFIQGVTAYGHLIDVRKYGANCEDSSSDQTAIDAAKAVAYATGGIIWIPAAADVTKGCLFNVVHNSSLSALAFAGEYQRSIVRPALDGSAVFVGDATANSIQPLQLDGLQIKYKSGFTNSRGILFKGGYTGSLYVISDHHSLTRLDIDGGASYELTSCIEVRGRQIYSNYFDINCRSTSQEGIKITENNTPEYDGAFNNNSFIKVRVGTVKKRGVSIDYTRTSLGESIATANVFTFGTIEGTCSDITVTDCAGFYAKNTRSTTVRSNHLEDNGTLSSDGKGAMVRFTGDFAQGFIVDGNEMTAGQYGTYVDALLAFGVIGGGNNVTVSTMPILVDTDHAQSDIKILDPAATAGRATIIPDSIGQSHVSYPGLAEARWAGLNNSASTTEDVTGKAFLVLTNSTARTLTTLTGGVTGQIVTVYQSGAGTITLTQGAGTDQLFFSQQSTQYLFPFTNFTARYDGTKWLVIAQSEASTIFCGTPGGSCSLNADSRSNGNVVIAPNGAGLIYATNGLGNVTGTKPWIATANSTVTGTGLGTTPAITPNGSFGFKIVVGTAPAAASWTVTLPIAASNGWDCRVTNLTASAAHRADVRVQQTGGTTTTAVMEYQTVSTGAVAAMTAADVLSGTCVGY